MNASVSGTILTLSLFLPPFAFSDILSKNPLRRPDTKIIHLWCCNCLARDFVTMEPQYNKPLYNETRGITKDISWPQVETILDIAKIFL